VQVRIHEGHFRFSGQAVLGVHFQRRQARDRRGLDECPP
jgi:hypothetical protein